MKDDLDALRRVLNDACECDDPDLRSRAIETVDRWIEAVEGHWPEYLVNLYLGELQVVIADFAVHEVMKRVPDRVPSSWCHE